MIWQCSLVVGLYRQASGEPARAAIGRRDQGRYAAEFHTIIETSYALAREGKDAA
jgi:hypothetical protein